MFFRPCETAARRAESSDASPAHEELRRPSTTLATQERLPDRQMRARSVTIAQSARGIRSSMTVIQSMTAGKQTRRRAAFERIDRNIER